jgi:hypothetical protein
MTRASGYGALAVPHFAAFTIDSILKRWLGSSFALALLACRQGGPSGSGGSSGACPAEWLEPPAVDARIAVPSGNGHIVLHAAAKGSQNYTCAPVTGDGGARYAWAPVGPEATLSDCHSAAFGRHFASEAGAGEPEWQTFDGAYVVARKVAASTVDGGSVPWLLLTVDGHSATAPFTDARYVQRVRTSGGIAPSAPCDATRVGTLEKVPYLADYFFYAP